MVFALFRVSFQTQATALGCSLPYRQCFRYFITLLKYLCVPLTVYLIPPFHERMACSTLFLGLWNDWNKINISLDFATLKRSASVNLFLLLRFFRILLHSATMIGVICIAPQEFPLTARGFPLLSTYDSLHHWILVKRGTRYLVFLVCKHSNACHQHCQ